MLMHNQQNVDNIYKRSQKYEIKRKWILNLVDENFVFMKLTSSSACDPVR